jgi:GT2 family glycosyltransferase
METMKWPKASLIISNLNGKYMLRECLQSLFELDYPDYEIIVVDAGSTDGTPDMVSREFPQVRLLKDGRIGIGEAINKGFAASGGDIIAFDLNNDETFSRGWLKTLVNELCSSQEKKVVSGVRVYYGTDGIIQSAGARATAPELSLYGGVSIEDVPKKPFEVDHAWVCVFKRELLGLIGFCDEKFYIYFEDSDFCERAKRAGYKIFVVPTAVSYHRGGATLKTFGARLFYHIRRGQVRFFIKHFGLKRMVFALINWAFGTILDILYCPLGRARIESRRLSSKESCELCKVLLKCILWNLRNIGDHVKSRLIMRSIRPSTQYAHA